MAARPSVRKIAEEAGVSHMTVSLALRNDTRISIPTRDRILAIADRMGYRPDPMVSRVMSNLRFTSDGGNTIAFVTKIKDDKGWESHHVYGQVFKSAALRLKEVGYKLDIFPLDTSKLSGNRLSKILYTRGIRGILCMAMQTRFVHLSMDLTNVSSVLFGPNILRPALHRVLNHQFHTITLALRKLKQLGNRRITMAMLKLDTGGLDHYWNAGFLTFSQMFPELTVPPFLGQSWDQKEFLKWFKQHNPDAIVSLGTNYIPWLEEIGVGIPHDVHVALLDLVPGEKNYAGINQNHDVVGTVASELLLGQMYFNEIGIPKHPRSILVDGTWADGPSVQRRR